MRLLLDVHLPPAIVPWQQTSFSVEAVALRDMGLKNGERP